MPNPTPRTAARTPKTVRSRREWSERSSAGRRASIGGSDPARRAGSAAAMMVMIIPTTKGTMMALGVNVREMAESPSPTWLSTLITTTTSDIPMAMPVMQPITPAMAASANTEVRTWSADTPMLRRRANSRVRWPRIMAKVLVMMNDPTNRAMTPKAASM